MRKHSICILLAISLVAGAPSVALAEGSNGYKKVTNDKVTELKSKIEDLKDKKKDVTNQLDEINRQIQDTFRDIEEANNKIINSEEEIGDLSKQLSGEIKKFDEQRELYDKRVKVMYMNGSGSYLDVLLSSESFSDLISRFYIISKISEFDNNLLNEIKESQKNIQKKKQSIELKQKELLSLKAELTVKQNELKKANIEKQSYYDSINEDLVNTEKILEKEVEESNRIKEEIRTVTEKNFSSDQDNSKKHSEDRIKQESRQESKQESRQEVKQKSKQESGKRAAILKTSDTGYSPVITSPFGMRFHPILKTYKMHTGIDYAAPNGTPIYAMSDGKVIVSRYSNSYGNYVVIDHGDGISTLYSHNSSNLVSVGESVKAGQAVAEMGETGYATGPHVHFEVRINGEPVNPEPYVIIGD